MRSNAQTVLVLFIVAGVIGLATYLKTYDPTPPSLPPLPSPASGPSTDPNVPAVVLSKLNFPQEVLEWGPEYSGEFELNFRYHHDFWFHNPNPVAMEIGLAQRSCKCAKVEVCTFDGDEGKRYQDWLRQTALAQVAVGQQGLLPLLSQLGVARYGWGKRLAWRTMEPGESTGSPIPAKGSGMVRVSWEGNKVGQERLTVDLWAQAQEGKIQRTYTHLEVPLHYVPPFRVNKLTEAIGDLHVNDVKVVEFLCFSTTRGWFPLAVKNTDPCFLTTCVPLTEKECRALSTELKTNILSGYRVTVKVQERVSDQVQLDLGPFQRKIELLTDVSEEPVAPIVSGVVRGEVTVGAPEDKDKIHLGNFRADRGSVKKQVRLTTEQTGLELIDLEYEPSYLKVEWEKVGTKGGRTDWMLSVMVPPHRASGQLPPNSAVVLKIKGEPPRRIRIPVTGNAYH